MNPLGSAPGQRPSTRFRSFDSVCAGLSELRLFCEGGTSCLPEMSIDVQGAPLWSLVVPDEMVVSRTRNGTCRQPLTQCGAHEACPKWG